MIFDLSAEEEFAYLMCNTVNSELNNNLLIIEFHEIIEDGATENLEEFRNRSTKYYSAFMNPNEVDNFPATIHLAVKIMNEWTIVKDCGSNYYLGYGPTGILLLRKACKKKGVKIIYKEGDPFTFFKENSDNIIFTPKKQNKLSEYENVIEILVDTCNEIEKRKKQYQDLGEENIRERMLVSLNPALKNRVFGETINVNGKTDILIKSEDLKEQFIFELKIWSGISEFKKGLEQLLSYLTWNDNMAGMVIFSHLKKITKTLSEINEYLKENKYNLIEGIKMKDNEIRCLVPFPSDLDRLIQIHIIVNDLNNE